MLPSTEVLGYYQPSLTGLLIKLAGARLHCAGTMCGATPEHACRQNQVSTREVLYEACCKIPLRLPASLLSLRPLRLGRGAADLRREGQLREERAPHPHARRREALHSGLRAARPLAQVPDYAQPHA